MAMTVQMTDDVAMRLREAVEREHTAKPGMVYCNCAPGMCAHYQERGERYAAFTAALDRLLAYTAAQARVEALERCFGQRDEKGDALLFVVRVDGIGAKPESPRQIARTLAANWSQRWPDVWTQGALIVEVADDLKDAASAALAALEDEL